MKKRRMFFRLFAVLSSAICMSGLVACGMANDTELIDGLEFNLIGDSHGYQVMGTSDAETDTDIVIPAYCKEKPVISIGYYAFQNFSELKSVTIPDSVTEIGMGAFYNCSSLTNITFKGTKAQWEAIQKGETWITDNDNYTIHCTDGDISE